MTDHLPLLVFPKSTPIEPGSGRGFPPTQPKCPDHQDQVSRLQNQINSLRKNIKDDFKIYKSMAGLEPESVLVIKIAGSVNEFKQAIEKSGFEWLSEFEIDEIEPSEGFYARNHEGNIDTNRLMDGRLFLFVTNQKSLDRFITLWRKWKDKVGLPHGETKWGHVFNQLIEIRRWGIQEQIFDTGMYEKWEDYEFPINPNEKVYFQIEFFYRNNQGTRNAVQNLVQSQLENLDGRILSCSDISEISFHAVKAELPAYSISKIIKAIKNDAITTYSVDLIKLPGIMYYQPSGQNLTNPEGDEGIDFQFPEVSSEQEPIAALIDGYPLLHHEALKERVLIDDIFELEGKYHRGERKHGTSMASLILHGDQNNEYSHSLSRKLYCIPIMQPNSNDQYKSEHIPEDVFLEDRLHIAIKNMLEGDVSKPPMNGIKLINLSIGDPERIFIHTLSPWARLLDWLSWKYRILFCVSSGNFVDSINLGMNHKEFSLKTDDDKVKAFIDAVHYNQYSRRIMAPAESLNSLTVGAAHYDDSVQHNHDRRVDILPNNDLLSPLSRIGYGFRRSIKPEILMPGGRQLYEPPMQYKDHYYNVSDYSSKRPGQKVATDSTSQGELSKVKFSCGTSNSAALATRAGIQIYDTLCQLGDEEGGAIPENLVCVVIKALLVHGAKQPKSAQQKLRDALITPDNSRRAKQIISRYIGYGIPDIKRVLECTKHRVTVVGCGEIKENGIHEFHFPLPVDIAKKDFWRRLTITLAWLSPINPDHRNLREAKLNFEPGDTKKWEESPLKVKRQDANNHQTLKGTVQHEVMESRQLIDDFTQDGSNMISIRVVCKKDATTKLDEEIPYGLAVTLEISEDVQVDIYQQIKLGIHNQVKDQAQKVL